MQNGAAYFGADRVPAERLNECMANFDAVRAQGLRALDRKQTSDHDIHFYKHAYFGHDPAEWPQIKVPLDLYQLIFKLSATIAVKSMYEHSLHARR